MRLSAHIKRSIAGLLMAAAVFAQWVLPASAYAAMPVAQVAVMDEVVSMTCHDQAPGKGTCIEHCSQADQASLDHANLVAPPASTAAWHIAIPQARVLASGMRPAAEPQRAAGPPLPILYCSLLN